MDKHVFYSEMVRFLQDRNSEPIDAIGPEENLIRKGLVDSFMIMEIVMKVEAMTNRPVDLDNLKVEHIVSIEQMYEYFILKESV